MKGTIWQAVTESDDCDPAFAGNDRIGIGKFFTAPPLNTPA
jgi:hypothetical protein